MGSADLSEIPVTCAKMVNERYTLWDQVMPDVFLLMRNPEALLALHGNWSANAFELRSISDGRVDVSICMSGVDGYAKLLSRSDFHTRGFDPALLEFCGGSYACHNHVGRL